MIQVNISEAKTQLSKLVDKTSKGELVIITKAGKPLVKMLPVDPPKKQRLLGCMCDVGYVDPNIDIKSIARDEIMAMSYGEDEKGS